MLTLAEIVGSVIAGAVLEVVERTVVGAWRALRWLGCAVRRCPVRRPPPE